MRALRFRPPERFQYGRLYYRPSHSDESLVRRRLILAGVALFAVFVLGSAGYHAMGRGAWSYADCAYMVLITITSVGYGEVIPVHEVAEGRAFTMALLVTGTGVSFYFLSALTAFIIEGDLREAIWRRRMERRLRDLQHHIIVAGAGRTGLQVIRELCRGATTAVVVVVERDPDALEAVTRAFGARVVGLAGDATLDGVLRDAGVERAAGLVSALQNDQDNLFVALSARQLNADIRIVCRANEAKAAPKLRQAGANSVVSPIDIGGRRLAQQMLRPNVISFLEVMREDLNRAFDIEQVEVPEGSPLVGRVLAESGIRDHSDALVLAVRHPDGDKTTYNPGPSFSLAAGMTLVVLGETSQLARLRDLVTRTR
ncbi:MAG: potassium channel protein [Myxococcota bacterium]